jgi:hypothetical protein
MHIEEAVEIRAVHDVGAEVGAESRDGEAFALKGRALVFLARKTEQHAADSAGAQRGLEARGIVAVLAQRKDFDAKAERGRAALDAVEFPAADILRAPVLAPA